MNETPIHDSGRFPLLLRMPSAMLALFAAVQAVRFGLGALGMRVGITGEGGTSELIAACGMFCIAWGFGMVWFSQVKVLFDEIRRELIVRKRGYFKFSDTRYDLRQAERLRVEEVRAGICSRCWVLYVDYLGGRTEEVQLLPHANVVGEALSKAAGLPVAQRAYR